ncbi:lytic transglycosylase domain-containing protein [Streptomyces sp. NPDC048172]|uniref:lytic transglycosylase domain-containing protein n=1 Tax=Streptomyces sp. NPDC048172 TaxID=3365505 RepID=UPI00370FC933
MARYRGRHAAAKQKATGTGEGGTHRLGGFVGTSRFRRGLGGTAVAAVAMAALTASQAPGAVLGGGGKDDGKRADAAPGDRTPGDGSFHTELPPLESPEPPDKRSPDVPGMGDAESGIPASLLSAYKNAEKRVSPGCGLPWELLAGIGKVESGQARGGAVDKEGTTLRPILGPVLNGEGFASIKDTDGGEFDGDAKYDRAVGPMQFIPSTWERWGQDGNNDGRKDPNNIHDAALAAGEYLCASDRNLAVKADLDRAILSYNNSSDYLRTVLAWFNFYREGTHEVPDGRGVLPTSPGAGGSDESAKGSPDGGSGSGSGGKGSGKGEGKPGKDKPGKPGKGGSGGKETDKPGKPGRPGGGGGGGSSPSPSPSDPGEPTPSPSPTGPASLERVGAKNITAVAGSDFAERPRVRVENSKGKGVKNVKVQFEIRGETGAAFSGGAKKITVRTGADGLATAPALAAGDAAGSFTLRATVPGEKLAAVDFGASVTAPEADALTRTTDSALETAKGDGFAKPVEVKATNNGKVAKNVAVSATMADAAKGPFFKDANGKPLRALKGLKTNANGVLKLPTIYADGNAGTFTLRLKATGGATLAVKLTVK